MILEILKYPDPRLANVCKPVANITDEIRELAHNMLETMYKAEGVGLAAPQIGQFLRLIIIDPFYREGSQQPRVLINPELEFLGELITSPNEGCLSVPYNYRADVARHSTVRLKALGLDGQPIDEILEGLPAIVVQHEVDHLDGKLFIDKISHLRRSIYDGKVKKWQKSNPPQ